MAAGAFSQAGFPLGKAAAGAAARRECRMRDAAESSMLLQTHQRLAAGVFLSFAPHPKRLDELCA
jgi:hypothetical protein